MLSTKEIHIKYLLQEADPNLEEQEVVGGKTEWIYPDEAFPGRRFRLQCEKGKSCLIT